MSIKQTIDEGVKATVFEESQRLIRTLRIMGVSDEDYVENQIYAFAVEVIKAVRDEVKLMPGGYIEVGSVKEAEGYTKKQKEVDDKLNTIIKELEE